MGVLGYPALLQTSKSWDWAGLETQHLLSKLGRKYSEGLPFVWEGEERNRDN